MNIVIVDSQPKADFISKVLGSEYQVKASSGFVRELPAGLDSINTEDQFNLNWQVLPKFKHALHEIADATDQADGIIIAVNPDREGEANSWHILETLHNWNALKGKQVQRVTFNALTKESILEAFSKSRKLAAPLIDAYRAQYAIDHIIHFNLNALFSQKLPGMRVTNREQSATLKVICDRESEIERSNLSANWSLKISHRNDNGGHCIYKLSEFDGKEIDSQNISTKEQAESLKQFLQHAEFQVYPESEKIEQIAPPPPYNTTTLLIDAARILGFSTTKTIQCATKLYEGIKLSTGLTGLITFYFTESENINDQTVFDIRQFIQNRFGTSYLPETVIKYPTHEKNAYETHGAIHPISIALTPDEASTSLSPELANLYELIWNRTIASQINPAVNFQIHQQLKVTNYNHTGILTTLRSGLQFDGFKIIYPENENSRPINEITTSINHSVKENLTIAIEKHPPNTPQRFDEAALIEKISKLEIGTPSSIAFIIKSLHSKEYIKRENMEYIPTDKGRIVNTFFDSFCKKLVDSNYTATIKNQLDLISDGKLSYHNFLTEFWDDFSNSIKSVQATDKQEIIETLNRNLSPIVFPGKADGTDPRSCPKCGNGILSLKFSRVGTYVACSSAPTCRYTRQLGYVESELNTNNNKEPFKVLGNDPSSGLEVSIRNGRYGIFVQLGIGSNPKRVTLPPNWGFDNVDLETAINFLALPREVGIHPNTGYPIHAGIGRYGPFVLHNSVYSRLNSIRDAFSVDLSGAIQAIAKNEQKNSNQSRSNSKSKKLGQHSNGDSIHLINKRFGTFLKYQNIELKLPHDLNPSSLTLDQAIKLIDQENRPKATP